MKWTPHEYQKRGIKLGVSQACLGLIWDPGLGKTTTMLAIFKLLKAKGLVKRMLVIAPLRVMASTWPGEAAKWENFQDLKVAVLHGPDKERALASPADVYVINPEGLPWLFSHEMPWWWDVLCVDESTRFKHTNTQRFKQLKPHLGKFRRRYILTGTPAPNGLLDLFGQIYLLDLGNALTPFITRYRTAFFNPTGFGGYTWVPKEGAQERIYKLLGPLTCRMEAADWLELPELVFNRVEVELPPAAMKMYVEMENEMLAELGDEKITAANAATATGKCRQIANGGLYVSKVEDGEMVREWRHIHDAKTEAVLDLLEELQGTPALVAYEFDHDRERLQAALKKAGYGDVPYIGGGVSTKRFKEIEAEWNAGKLPVLLAQPQSVAHGLNLQGTRAHIIEHSTTWNLEDREQFIRRVWRQGQKERVVVHSLVAKNTIDRVIHMMLARKDKTQKALLDALKAYKR